MRNSSITSEVSAQELAGLLGVTDRTVRNLAAAGTITRAPTGKYPLAASIRAIIAEAKKSMPVNNLSRENEAIAAGKRRLIEIQVAERDGRLIDLTEAIDCIAEVVGIYRSGLSGLPARLARGNPVRMAEVRAEIDAMLTKVSQKIERLKLGKMLDYEGDDDEQ